MNYLILMMGYVVMGVTLEVFWTAITEFPKQRKFQFQGHSYLWMFPLYATIPFVYKVILFNFQESTIFIRAFFYMLAFYALELIFGYTIKKFTGKCPWDYSHHSIRIFGKTIPMHFLGIVSFHYAIVWYVYGLIFEFYYHFLMSI